MEVAPLLLKDLLVTLVSIKTQKLNRIPAEMRLLADAALPPSPPKPPSVERDCPKSGELRLPTGEERLLRLKRF